MLDQGGTITQTISEMGAIRVQIQDLSDRAAAAWQRMSELRGKGAMAPDDEVQAAGLQIVYQRYRDELVRLDGRQRRLTDQINDLTNEKRNYIKSLEQIERYLDERREIYEKYVEAERRANEIRNLDPNDHRLREATRAAISEFVGILNGYRDALQQQREYDARLSALGA